MSTLPKKIKIGDKRFFLTLIRFDGRDKSRLMGLFRCDCGDEKRMRIDSRTKSCGCQTSNLKSASLTKHGESRHGSLTPEYSTWAHIKQRCLNKRNKRYMEYGGRGITICDRWKNSFANFLADMGRSGGLTIDRINNDGNYEPSNCRWATTAVQAANKSNTRYVVYRGERMLVTFARKLAGIHPGTFYRRKKAGLDDERNLNTPMGPKRKKCLQIT